jgi:hypothetical protein
VQKEKQQLKENSKYILLHMLTCTRPEFALVKITPGGKKGSRKKAAGGGLMAGMTRKRRAACA